jgi:hypothetical protein
MQQRLDLVVVRRLGATDEHADKITVKDDAVFCAPCWASITGPDYKA